MALAAPVPITAAHRLDDFRNQHPDLVDWLQRRALANDSARASRTFVLADGKGLVGYYALAAGAVFPAPAPGSLRRNMPAPIPAIVLGRLAVDLRWQGRGLGADLLSDAVRRSLLASCEIGARAMVCHAIDAAAMRFYQHHGFRRSPGDERLMLLGLARLA